MYKTNDVAELGNDLMNIKGVTDFVRMSKDIDIKKVSIY